RNARGRLLLLLLVWTSVAPYGRPLDRGQHAARKHCGAFAVKYRLRSGSNRSILVTRRGRFSGLSQSTKPGKSDERMAIPEHPGTWSAWRATAVQSWLSPASVPAPRGP